MATALQLVGVQIPVDMVQMLPFISVMVVLILFARDARLPSALGCRTCVGVADAPDRRVHHLRRHPTGHIELLLDLERVAPCVPGARDRATRRGRASIRAA